MSPACSVEDFEFVRKFVHEQSAIAIEDDKLYLVEARLGAVARREGMASVGGLIGALRSGAPKLATAVVEAMTTNETSFFRDAHPFEALRTDLIPRILDANGGAPLAMWRPRRQPVRRLTAWPSWCVSTSPSWPR